MLDTIAAWIDRILAWFQSQYNALKEGIYNLFVDFIQSIIDVVVSVFHFLINLLPQTPDWLLNMLTPPQVVIDIVHQLNYFIPIPTILLCVLALSGSYVYRLAARPILKYIFAGT